MKAVVFYKQEDVRVEDVPDPRPAPGMVKLENAFTGICGSDLHVYFAPETSGLDFTKPHPVTGSMPPQILGHEFSGTVVELGEGVTNVAVGDRVAVYPMIDCGHCAACQKGARNICRNLGTFGLSSDGGGMAKYTTLGADRLHKLPADVDLRMGALVEPMAVGWRAVSRGGITPGQTALIAGAGPIGISLWFALKAHGVDNIIFSEPNAQRRQVIKDLGAEHVIDPGREDLSTYVQKVTDGRGADVAFDAAGAAAAVQGLLDSLAPQGRLVVVAIHEKPVSLSPTQLVFNEVEIVGSLAYKPADLDAVIQAMSNGLYSYEGWTSIIDYEDVTQAFGDLRGGIGMKVLVRSR